MADTGAPGTITSITTGTAAAAESVGRPAPEAERTIRQMGARVRALRKQQNLTLKSLADRTGVSVSMLSMVERGLASASVGTLVSVSAALGVHMSELFGSDQDTDRSPVTRIDEQATSSTGAGEIQRIAYRDPRAGVELAVRQYLPGAAGQVGGDHSDDRAVAVLIAGELTVELDGQAHHLHQGDAVSFLTSRPCRVLNRGTGTAQMVWLTLSP